jgi:hypothetical protein
LEEAYGADWLVSLYEGSDITAQGRSLRKQKRSQGVESDNSIMYDELLKDVVAGADAIARFADSDWWSWKQGSALFFWRWPKGEQRSFARDGMPPWIKTRLPRYTRRPRPPDPDKKPLVLVKLQTIIDRGYVVAPEDAAFIKSLMDYFDVEKGSDIRMVYNGTSCGLNDALWAPNFFLPTPASAARVLGYGYYMVNIDLGEMFLNFPLHPTLRRFSGVDLSHFVKDLKAAGDPTALLRVPGHRDWLHWVRCWMGLKPSPFMACGGLCQRKLLPQDKSFEVGSSNFESPREQNL